MLLYYDFVMIFLSLLEFITSNDLIYDGIPEMISNIHLDNIYYIFLLLESITIIIFAKAIVYIKVILI